MIQWITMQDWAGVNSRGRGHNAKTLVSMEQRRDAYWRRFDEMKGRLPEALVKADSLLHDARLAEVQSNSEKQELRLLVKPCDGKAQWWVFTGVRNHRWINHRLQLPGPDGFGDMGYSEIRLTSGGFAMAILFSSGLELVVNARGFRRTHAGHGKAP